MVMAYRLNVPVWCVSIMPIPQEGTQGHTVDESAAAGVEAFAQIMLAGYAACIAAGFDERKAMVGKSVCSSSRLGRGIN